jgi:hypothetical protein
VDRKQPVLQLLREAFSSSLIVSRAHGLNLGRFLVGRGGGLDGRNVDKVLGGVHRMGNNRSVKIDFE